MAVAPGLVPFTKSCGLIDVQGREGAGYSEWGSVGARREVGREK